MKKIIIAIAFVLISLNAQAADDQSMAMAQLSAKITNLEEENRRLNGRVDELEHELSALQNPVVKAQTPVVVTPGMQPVLGQQPPQVTSVADGSSVTRPNQYVTKVEPASSEKNEGLENEFDQIFKSVAAEDYKTAKPALKAFIEKHPGTDLAGEAYFWLGEIAWSERDFNTSAIDYLKGYKEAPKGEKAPENILKMALTLKELGKKDEACKYVERFETEFPDAHRDLQGKAAAAKTDLGCK